MSERRMEIVNAAHEALRITVNWIQEVPKTEATVPTPLVISALTNMVLVADAGDVPSDCQDLWMAIRKFGEELHQFMRNYDGKVNPNGSPVGSFWGAIGKVESIAAKADRVYIPTMESIAELRRQGVSDEQIAMHIYGHRGSGPFVGMNQTINKRLIDQAAKGPEELDKILEAAGWPKIEDMFVPPWMVKSDDSRQQAIKRRLETFKALEEGPKMVQDPATVAEMIEDGCYVQQIMKWKGVTRNHVLAESRRIGIAVQDQPGAGPTTPVERSDIETAELKAETENPSAEKPNPEVIPPAQASQVESTQPTEPEPSMSQIASDLRQMAEADAISETARMAVIACKTANPTFGAAEIAIDIAEDGHKITARDIGKILREEKAKQAAAAK